MLTDEQKKSLGLIYRILESGVAEQNICEMGVAKARLELFLESEGGFRQPVDPSFMADPKRHPINSIR